MKIETPQVPGKYRVTMTRLLEPRLALQRATIMHNLRVAEVALPVQNLMTLALALIMKPLLENAKDMSIVQRLRDLSKFFYAIHEYLIKAAEFNIQKANEQLSGGELIAAIAQQVGLTALFARNIATDADAIAIIQTATANAAGAATRVDAAATIACVAEYTKWSGKDDYAFLRGLKDIMKERVPFLNIMVGIRLMELAAGELKTPTHPVEAATLPKPEQVVSARSLNVRSIAAIFASIEVICANDLRHHVTEITKHRWMVDTLVARGSFDLSSALAEWDARQVRIPNAPRWEEWSTKDLFEERFLPTWARNVPEPTRELNLVGPDWGNALVGDFSLEVDITPDVSSRLTNMVWEFQTATEKASAFYDQISGMNEAHGNFAPCPQLTVEQFSGGMSTVPRATSELMLVPFELPRQRYFADTLTWMLLKQPLNTFTHYTYAEVIAQLSATPAAQHIPIMVEGPEDFAFKALHRLGTLVPYFELFDAPAEPSPMNLGSLLMLWRMPPDIFQRYISTLAGDVDDIGLKVLAQSLRYVGQLSVRPKGSKNGGVVVYPLDRLWYHASDLTAVLDADHPILLGTQRTAMFESKRTEADVILTRFTHLPHTADPMSILNDGLKAVPVHQIVAHKPSWVFEFDKPVKPTVGIRGWKLHPKPVVDIITVPMRPADGGFDPISIDSDEEGFPQRAYHYNAEVTIRDATTESTSGVRVPVPPPYISIAGSGT